MLAADDLGRAVATAFDQPGTHTGALYDLAGDELSMVEIADTFSRVM